MSHLGGFLSCYIAEKFRTLYLSVNDCEEEILMAPFPILLTAPHDHRARAAEHSRHEINCLREDLRDLRSATMNDCTVRDVRGAVRLKIPWYNYR